MPILHENCYGKKYFLHQGKTKTGKPKYYMSMQTEGNFAETLPEGYEIYERPGGMVFVRKIPKTPILPHELKYVQEKIAPLVNEIDEENYAEWYSILSAMNPDYHSSESHAHLAQIRTRFEAEIRGKEIVVYEVRGMGNPIMKFKLLDEDSREYLAYRWCFRGRIDDWINIGSRGQLIDLVDKYCPALGTDQFFELW